MTVIILTLCLIFLHEGFSYYVSFQVLALLTIAVSVLSKFRSVSGGPQFFIVFAVFGIFLVYKAIVAPRIIIQNDDPNVPRAVVGILGYAFMIGSIPHIRFRQPVLILKKLRSASSATILILAGLLALSESNLIPFLNREAFMQQNTRLVENWAMQEAVDANLEFGMEIKPDLFYGEGSALAVVLFSCLGCFIISSKLLIQDSNTSDRSMLKSRFKHTDTIILIGLACLFICQSLSAIVYGVVILFFVYLRERLALSKLMNWKTGVTITIILAIFIYFSYDNVMFRMSGSGGYYSIVQRFGVLLIIEPIDFLLGFDESKIPDHGRLQMQNGVIYIIAISGLAGLLYLISLSYSVFKLSIPIKLSLFSVLLVLGTMMQNMGVFSPNKIVLLWLILLPLACGGSMYPRQRPVAIAGNMNE